MSLDPREIAIEPAAGVPSAKGTSLGYDAWRRLRRNRMAMFSLTTLITIALLAFLTPLLPLAAPDKHHTDLQYEPPKLTPLFVNTFSLNWTAIDEMPAKLASVYEDLATAKVRYEEIKRADPQGSGNGLRKAE